MPKKFRFLVLVAFVVSCVAFPFPVQAATRDLRPLKLAKFLSNHNPQLGYLAPVYVAQADRNGLDYRLLVAISGVESTFGQQYLSGTYNIYGWGAGTIPFQSWPDGIATVSEHLRTDYVAKGAADLSQIARIYCPPNSAHWAATVQSFMNQIDNIQLSESDTTDFPNPNLPSLDLTI